MHELTILSGKGGTGKTSLTASFAALAHNAVLADCDVDAPNLALVLTPNVERSGPFAGGKKARIREELCNGCGRCAEVCRYRAVTRKGPDAARPCAVSIIDPLSCEGCGVCVAFCPRKAIELNVVQNGDWFVSRTRHGPMVHARLGPGEDNSGKLVTLVRRTAKDLAERKGKALIITDGPPGIGCPAIASLTGADAALLVAEPTVSGLHDFVRVAALAGRFGLVPLACVNRFDINVEMTERIEAAAAELGVEMVGRIPYDEAVVRAQLCQRSVVEYAEGEVSAAIRKVWNQVESWLESGSCREMKSRAGV